VAEYAPYSMVTQQRLDDLWDWYETLRASILDLDLLLVVTIDLIHKREA
jgi:hypothetical protein